MKAISLAEVRARTTGENGAMGKRERKRRRAAGITHPPKPVPPEGESGLLAGQTDPLMRQKLQAMSDNLRARYRPTS